MDITTAQPAPRHATDRHHADGRRPDSLDYNAFLQLLIAQMKNQDPTKPTDPAQFIAQLASFSASSRRSRPTASSTP